MSPVPPSARYTAITRAGRRRLPGDSRAYAIAGPTRGSSVRTRAPQSAMTRSTAARASLRKAPSSEIGAAPAGRSAGGLQHPVDRGLGSLQKLARRLEAGDALLEQLQRAVQVEIVLLQGPHDGLQPFELFLERSHLSPWVPHRAGGRSGRSGRGGRRACRLLSSAPSAASAAPAAVSSLRSLR